MNPFHNKQTNAAVFIALIALAAGSRFLGAAPNFAAVAAAALFAGFFFSGRLTALAVPVLAMLIADCVHGFYDGRQMAVVYAMLCLPVLFRSFIRAGSENSARPSMSRVLIAAVVCSLAFFVFTNLAVWAFSPMYAHDAAGLTHCFELAIPFFRFTLAGDLIFAAGIFGAYRLAARAVQKTPALAAA